MSLEGEYYWSTIRELKEHSATYPKWQSILHLLIYIISKARIPPLHERSLRGSHLALHLRREEEPIASNKGLKCPLTTSRENQEQDLSSQQEFLNLGTFDQERLASEHDGTGGGTKGRNSDLPLEKAAADHIEQAKRAGKTYAQSPSFRKAEKDPRTPIA